MKALLAAAAIAALIASPAFARSAPNVHWQHPPQAPDGAASDDVIAGNKRIGRDPDPWIRNEMLRHFHSGWPDR